VLGASDREVDRLRAQARATAVGKAMDGISFEKAYAALPTHCLALMQNLPRDDQDTLAREIAALKARTDITDRTKILSLGLLLMNAVGEGVLVAAVDSLRAEIKS
jgi:hypothetical protein